MSNNNFKKFNKELIFKLNKNIKNSNFFEFYDKYHDNIEKLFAFSSNLDFFDIEKYAVLKLDRNSMKKIVFEFFCELDFKLYQDIVKGLKDSRTNFYELVNSDIDVKNFFSIKNGRRVIFLNFKPNIYSFVGVSHEFTHLTSIYSKELISSKHHLLSEIESKFIEKVFCDYLEKKQYVERQEIEKFLKFQNNNLKMSCLMLFQEFKFWKLFPEKTINKKVLKQLLSEKKSFQTQIEKDAFQKQQLFVKKQLERIEKGEIFAKPILKNIVGQLCAQVLFKDYQKNPVEVFNQFKIFLDCQHTLSTEQGLAFLLGKDFERKIYNEFCLEKAIDKNAKISHNTKDKSF